jgi:riboflavin-specific deaminase-like protein
MKISSNLAISLDGKIASRGDPTPLGTPYDRKQMRKIRKGKDAILIGATTLRTHPRPNLIEGAKSEPPANLILGRSLRGLDPGQPFFKKRGLKRVFFLAQAPSEEDSARFGDLCEYRVLDARPIAVQIVDYCRKQGWKELLVEGGGNVIWEFARHNLIDRYHVTLTPKIVGGSQAPSLVEGEGLSPKDWLKLKLSQSRRVGDELYLTYERRGKKRV